MSLSTLFSKTLSLCSSRNMSDQVSYPYKTTGKIICMYMFIFKFLDSKLEDSRSQWPRGLRRRPTAARLLRLWVRIPPRAWMFVCCECCVLSGRGLCDGLITRPEEPYRLWRVVVCVQETSKKRVG